MHIFAIISMLVIHVGVICGHDDDSTCTTCIHDVGPMLLKKSSERCSTLVAPTIMQKVCHLDTKSAYIDQVLVISNSKKCKHLCSNEQHNSDSDSDNDNDNDNDSDNELGRKGHEAKKCFECLKKNSPEFVDVYAATKHTASDLKMHAMYKHLGNKTGKVIDAAFNLCKSCRSDESEEDECMTCLEKEIPGFRDSLNHCIKLNEETGLETLCMHYYTNKNLNGRNITSIVNQECKICVKSNVNNKQSGRKVPGPNGEISVEETLGTTEINTASGEAETLALTEDISQEMDGRYEEKGTPDSQI